MQGLTPEPGTTRIGIAPLQRRHEVLVLAVEAVEPEGLLRSVELREGSLGKLAASEVARRAGRVHGSIAGAEGMLTEVAGDDDAAVVAEVLVSTPAQAIAGGTDEIQHNIIGENVLGLPKEPAVDRDVPFRDVGRR